MIRLRCSGCGKALAVKDELAGKMISCPGCNNKIRVSSPDPAADSEEIANRPEGGSLDGPSKRSAEPKAALRPSSPPREDAVEAGDVPLRRSRPSEYEDEDPGFEPRSRQRRGREEEFETRSRPRRTNGRSRGPASRVSAYAIFMISLVVLSLALIGLSFMFPELILPGIIFFTVLSGLGWFWLVGAAFKESPFHGLGVMVFPIIYVAFFAVTGTNPIGGMISGSIVSLFFPNIYAAIFAVLNFEEAKKPLFLHFLGSSLVLLLFLSVPDGPRRPRADPGLVAGGPVGGPPVARPSPVTPAEPPAPADPGSAEPGLRAHWSFDEGAGIKAKDSGPHGLEATLNGCTWVPGVRGMAVQLNGTTDHVQLSPSKVLSFADKAPFTVAAWVKTSKPKGMILSLRPETDSPYDMLNVVLNGGKLVVQIRQQGNPFYPDEATSTFAIHDDKWRHFAVTRTADGEVTLFLDGNRNATATGKRKGKASSQSGKIVTSNRALGVEALLLAADARPSFDRSRLEGCIDELSFFGDALSEAAIRKLSNLD
jgi:hypothetical protein